MKFFTTFLLFLLFFFQPLFAQVALDGQIDFTPANPRPYDKVKLVLKSYSFDVNASKISWYINKVLVKSDIGAKTYTLSLAEANKTFFVGVDVLAPNGQTFQTSIPITPHFTPLLIEGVEGYTPPFYEGRSLYGESARVRVVAFPVVTENRSQINKKNLVYKWNVNTIPFPDAGGYGKNSFIVRQDELEEENNVDVVVTSPSGETTLTERVSLRPYDLAPLFYEYDPLYGINLNKAYENSISITKPTKIYYSPYNFAYSKKTSYFNWSLNGLPITADSDFLINLIPKENTSGQSTLSLKADHTTKLLQSLNSQIVIEFDTTGETYGNTN